MKIRVRKSVVVFIVFTVLFISGVFIHGQDQLAEIDKLLENKTVQNCEKAIEGLKALLKNDPDNYQILYRLSNAYTGILDIKTSALRVEKDEYKPMLRELGTIANNYAKKAYEINPKDKDVVAANLVSYAYLSASYGVVKAVLKGAAGHYKELANELISIDDKYLGAFGYRMLGRLYQLAPWPVGSDKKAIEFYKKAIETDSAPLYSHYNLGLIYYQDKKYDMSREQFKFVWDNEPAPHEKHYMDEYRKMARFYVRQIDRITKRK